MSNGTVSQPVLRLGVLISGSGTTLDNLARRIAGGWLRNAAIQLVISSRRTVPGVEIARQANLPVEIIRKKDFPDSAAFSDAITAALDRAGVDLVVMAGFLCFWHVPPHYAGRVINIHPALLPACGGKGMYGRRVHEAVLASGAAQSGSTIHLVTNEYDRGPILAQRSVPVQAGDTPETLAERVMAAERELYPEVIQQIAVRGLAWLRRQACLENSEQRIANSET